jgi:membrane protein involved in D-alanine export
MLPFASLVFFTYAAIIVGMVHLLKRAYEDFVSYRNLLFGISALYVFVFFDQTLQVVGFVIYSYLTYFFFGFKVKGSNRLLVSLLLALPLIILKLKFHISWIGFAGISYMTFRTIQIYIDAVDDQKPMSLRDYFTFLTFTPTLLIGPIDRAERFLTNMDEGYQHLNFKNLMVGWRFLIYGVLLKYVSAELVLRYWLPPQEAEMRSVLEHVNCAFSYSLYLYFDFAGYSLLAMGFGYMLGITVPENFNMPFLSVNPKEFWTRWHITLGNWLRDYFFRPGYKWLSGYKSLHQFALLKQNVALFCTFLLMGMWNGLTVNFVASGAVFGFYSVVHNTYVFQSKKKSKDVFFGNMPDWAKKGVSILLMNICAVFAIYVFSGRLF